MMQKRRGDEDVNMFVCVQECRAEVFNRGSVENVEDPWCRGKNNRNGKKLPERW